MKITLCQLNTVVGDIRGNVAKVRDGMRLAHGAGADLAVFQELCVTGYPPKDLLESNAFLEQAAAVLEDLAAATRATPGMGVVVGLPLPSGRARKGVANAAVLLADGAVVHVQEKSLLPTYDVFDEARYFDSATEVAPVRFKDEVVGLTICEDAWNDPELFKHRSYDSDPVAELAARGATLVVNISASPFAVGKERFRLELMQSHARRHALPMVFVNQVGGNDELVFDGRSLAVDGGGVVRAALPMFAEAIETVDTAAGGGPVAYDAMDEVASIHAALILGTRDYLAKCGFAEAVVGVSGGVDSAVTLAIAVAALGADAVRAVAMPSPHSSPASLTDAQELAENLGLTLDVIPIADAMAAYDRMLADAFAGRAADVTEENLQARIRGNILMAYSNKFGSLVLSTGNKSELAVGYCTLYGDMSGGLAVISDVPKTTVYRLAEYINRERAVIPAAILAKEPSAELRPGQRDSDSLPPYETLDAILDLYVEEGRSRAEIVGRGFAASTVDWVLDAVRRNEHKRKQAAPGLKVTSKAFGVGRRFPVAARYTV